MTTELHNRKPTHDWRREPAILRLVYSDPTLMQILLQIAKGDLNRAHRLAMTCAGAIRTRLIELQQAQQNNLDPSHPTVVNNPNHPMNPANQNALLLLLLVNPSLNPLFVEYVNTQAAVVETENEETSGNELQYDNLMETLLATALVQGIATSEQDSETNPYQTLGLSPNASQEEIQAQIAYLLAQNAPEEGAAPSKEFHAVAHAAVLIGTGEARKLFDHASSSHHHESSSSMSNSLRLDH